MKRKFVLEVEIDPDHDFLRMNLDGNVIEGHWVASLPLLLQRLEQRVVTVLQTNPAAEARLPGR